MQHCASFLSIATFSLLAICSVHVNANDLSKCDRSVRLLRISSVDEYYPSHTDCSIRFTASVEVVVSTSGKAESMQSISIIDPPQQHHDCISELVWDLLQHGARFSTSPIPCLFHLKVVGKARADE